LPLHLRRGDIEKRKKMDTQMIRIDFKQLAKIPFNVHVYRLAKGFEELVRVAHVGIEYVVIIKDGQPERVSNAGFDKWEWYLNFNKKEAIPILRAQFEEMRRKYNEGIDHSIANLEKMYSE